MESITLSKSKYDNVKINLKIGGFMGGFMTTVLLTLTKKCLNFGPNMWDEISKSKTKMKKQIQTFKNKLFL